ncbi:MAG: 50S ribosomal protein L24 [Alphaproteobacteria bacterium]|nr:50S ribosomal protein L24 [Alphaproteobacteria bacterium]
MTQINLKKPKLKIKKGDQVIVITGKDKGAKGEVIKILTASRRVVVRGVNIVTKHNKPSQVSSGGIEKKELSLHISNVALADPKTGNPTRIGYKTLKDGKKVRVARKSGETIE